MTKAIAVLLAALMLPLGASPLAAEADSGHDDALPAEQITYVSAVSLNGLDACQPGMVLVSGGEILLPFVCISMAAGFTDIDCSDDGAVTVSDGVHSVTADPRKKYLCVDDHYIWLGKSPVVDLDELLIPLDALCGALALDSTWSQDSGTLYLTPSSNGREWVEHDPHLLLWLARVVWAEARGECLEGQIAVAQVVLNRMASPYYPDSVTGVLFQPYQFSTVDSGAIWNDANDECYLAARLALDGADIVGDDCLFFNSCPGYTAGLTYLVTIGGHKFYSY